MQRFIFNLVLLIAVAGSLRVQASEWIPLQNRSDLWGQVTQSMDKGQQASLSINKLAEKSTQAESSQIEWILVKSISGKIRFEHYDTFYQGYPVLNGRIILAKKSQDQVSQVMGALASGLSADLPDVSAAFSQSESSVRAWLHKEHVKGHNIQGLELYPAIHMGKVSVKDKAKAVYRITYRAVNNQGLTIQRPQMIVDGKTLEVIKQWDTLDKTSEITAPGGAVSQLIAGGGAGGNELLGLNCYAPSADSMASCMGYQGIDSPVVSEVIFQNNRPDNIYSAFSGYPFVVTQEGDDCRLKNDYVTTIKAEKDTPSDSAFQYSCDNSGEHFDQQAIDDNYWYYYSYFPINDAHFYAGVVMQMYDQYLREIYPQQAEDCPAGHINTGYCLKPIAQRANTKGLTGGDMSNANWDGEYVNYGNGGPGDLYSQTTIDLVAHEVSHAITEWNSDPVWEGQSRALDESFSDIAAMAANDYLQQHLSGSYASSLAYMNKREAQWIYGWDVFPYGGGRDLQLPSRDGRSIDDARDYEEGLQGHTAGGVMNKLFYELVTHQDWSIEETFKLMLEANVSCWSTEVDFEDAGTCLLLLTHDVNKLRQLDETLHSVGIFSAQSEINVLPFSLQQQQAQVVYQVMLTQELDKGLINSIDLTWGDSSAAESWRRDSGVEIDTYLQRLHDYTEAGFMLFSIKVTLADGSEWLGYRNLHISSDVVPTDDTSPDVFLFPAEIDVSVNEIIHSQEITISGINAATNIEIDGGEYSIDGSEFTSLQGVITNGKKVRVKMLSSSSPGNTTQARLTVGDKSAMFSITTEGPIVGAETNQADKGNSGGAVSFLEILLLICMVRLANATTLKRRWY